MILFSNANKEKQATKEQDSDTYFHVTWSSVLSTEADWKVEGPFCLCR